MATSDVLNFTEIPTLDDGIERVEFHEYEPQQDLFTLPSEAYLLFKGRLLKLDGTAYVNADVVSLTNNGIMHIFGFCDDYNRVIYEFKHTLTLVRKGDTEAIFRNAIAAAGKVNLDKISLFMPHVIPSDIETVNLYKSIESTVTLPVTFRARQCDTITVPQSTTFSWRLSVKTSQEKPRYIIVGFQTNKDGNQEVNSSIFDHCDLKNIYTMLNQERYLAVDYKLSFPNHQFLRAYRDASVFSEKFYGMNDLITQSNITPSDYKDLYPHMVFDVSRESEKLKPLAVDTQI
ncbi:uncharacterized protein LOC136088012 [Hydra vulgaris]|uniref:Uncharacterized protein LOC136088012 n=1 Tax=Hydra vulgaris TaxID=6087 RepID=A0ABM4D0F1_HYDVU